MSLKKTKVLIIDDSAMIREALFSFINSFQDFYVVGVAENPKIGAEKIIELKPDIITLDIEMPVMDGLTFLEKLMRIRPIPVVMISSYTDRNSKAALMALELGAVDYIKKPQGDLSVIKEELLSKLLACKIARVTANPTASQNIEKKFVASTNIKPKQVAGRKSNKIIVIGASTGGTVALTKLFNLLPQNMPPIVIVQHMPPGFTKTFSDRLNNEGKLYVKEAAHDDILLPGHAYIAPGGKQTEIIRNNGVTKLVVSSQPAFNRHCPSVDFLFLSVAKNIGKDAIGVIMTGMGDDGANGMFSMKKSGAFNIAQNEESCTVYGMPKVAISKGCVDLELNIESIASELVKYCENE